MATEAGVSKQTVSRVINRKGEISEATRERTLLAIAHLGYRPSGIARGLATSETLTMGLIVPDISYYFFSEIARGVEDTARSAGFTLLLCSTANDPEREADVLRTLEEKRVDGIVWCSSRLSDADVASWLLTMPAAVLVNRDVPGVAVDKVRVGDAAGAELAIQHLLRTSHRNIGLLIGPAGSYSARQRILGHKAALTAAGLAFDPRCLVASRAASFDSARQVALTLLAAHPEIDAFFCHGDLTAAGACQACAQVGRRIPTDMAIIGSDDTLIAELVTPSLTTLGVDKQEIGASAAGPLLARIASRGADYQEIIPARTHYTGQRTIADTYNVVQSCLWVLQSFGKCYVLTTRYRTSVGHSLGLLATNKRPMWWWDVSPACLDYSSVIVANW